MAFLELLVYIVCEELHGFERCQLQHRAAYRNAARFATNEDEARVAAGNDLRHRNEFLRAQIVK